MYYARVVLLLLLLAGRCFAAEAQGFVQPQSCDYFTGYLLHFEELDAKKLATPIVLMFPQSYFWDHIVEQKDPWRVSSPDCTSSSACQPDVQGTVHLREVHRGFSLRWRQCIASGISGEFSVELPDARRIEGSFHAQVRNPSRKIISE